MAGARILLVEDDDVLRDLLSRNLKARHHIVSMATDAHSAIELLREMSFDLDSAGHQPARSNGLGCSTNCTT